MNVGDRVRIVGRSDFVDRIGHLIAPDDPRIKKEWPEWEPINTVHGNFWVYLVEAFAAGSGSKHHTWQFDASLYEVIEPFPALTTLTDIENYLNGRNRESDQVSR